MYKAKYGFSGDASDTWQVLGMSRFVTIYCPAPYSISSDLRTECFLPCKISRASGL